MNTTFRTAITSVAFLSTVTPETFEEERIWQLRVVGYWVLMPIVIVVGVAINAVGIYLLHRPRMQSLPATVYFKLLFSLDVAILLAAINIAFTFSGCNIPSYSVARYVVHPLFTALYILQGFSNCTIVWLSYDRFLAVWFYHYYYQTQQPLVKKLRIIFTGLFCIAMHLRHLLEVSVLCFTDKEMVEVTNNTACEQGLWYVEDVLQRKGLAMAWEDGMIAARVVLLLIVPAVLVLVFSFGIVVGIFRHRLQNVAATTHTRDQAFSAIYITLFLSFTFIIMIVAGVTFISMHSLRCHGSFAKEVFRTVFLFLLLGQHTTHIFFLAINQIFRDELNILFNATKSRFNNTFMWMIQTSCPSFSTHTTSTMHKRHIKENPHLPHPMMSSDGEYTDKRMKTQTSVDEP
ncbi:hypothetical protein O3P69_020158 [Scylla paramamosain]|uniref:G-protein coupled receptors family 1 profile domain-containing protein n=1 Tax=Scylla paramamosain TaxID=85552 RepID=A0AAW0TK21_SCYPA